MVLPLLFGIIILVIAVYIALRILGNLIWGVLLIGLIFIASYLILGSFPDLKSVPIIGRFIPELPSTTGEFVTIIKNVLYSIDIITVTRDSSGNLLVAVANTGKLSVSDFKVLVDEKEVEIINTHKDPLKTGESTVLQLNWIGEYTKVTVQTKQVFTTFLKQ